MAGITTSTWAGFLKTKYAQNVLNTIPEDLVLERDFKFSTAKQIGEQYSQAVITALENGFTYGAAGAGNFNLLDPSASSIEKALVNGSQGVLKSGVDYETLSKALKKGEVAYGSTFDQTLKNMVQS